MFPSHSARVVLLAAGQGKRMQAAADDTPKSLLPIGGEPFAVRLVRQAAQRNISDITVVVGYCADRVQRTLAHASPVPLRFLVNDRYAADVNIHSLALALEADPSPCLVIESDIWLSETAWDGLLHEHDAERSVWYTRGRFQPSQMGGIAKSGADQRIVDLRIVKAYEEPFRDHGKLVGVTRIGPREAGRFVELLTAARDLSLAQYWLAPWIDNLGELPCFERDVGAEHAISVNTQAEYLALREYVER